MIIQFNKPTFCVLRESGGFDGISTYSTIFVDNKPFEVNEVIYYKKQGYADIHVWNDGYCDGESKSLINVPTSLFKQVQDANTDN